MLTKDPEPDDPTTSRRPKGPIPLAAGSAVGGDERWWDDPLELTGVILPAPDETSLREMAACFVEEFARDGWSDDRLRAMFRNPCYRGPYLVWRQKGDAYVDALIADVRKNRNAPMRHRTPRNESAGGVAAGRASPSVSGTSAFRAGTVSHHLSAVGTADRDRAAIRPAANRQVVGRARNAVERTARSLGGPERCREAKDEPGPAAQKRFDGAKIL